MANSKEITITFYGWSRAKKRNFAKIAEKRRVMNGWCSDGNTIRLLFETEAEKELFRITLKSMPSFNGEGTISVNG